MFEDEVHYVSVSGDNHTALSICSNGSVNVWDMHSRQVALNFQIDANWGFNPQRLSVDFEKNVLVCGAGENFITYKVDQHITAPQPFIWDNLTNVTGATNTDHSTVALSSPSLKKIYLWHVKSTKSNHEAVFQQIQTQWLRPT